MPGGSSTDADSGRERPRDEREVPQHREAPLYRGLGSCEILDGMRRVHDNRKDWNEPRSPRKQVPGVAQASVAPRLDDLAGGRRQIDGIPRPEWARVADALEAFEQAQDEGVWTVFAVEWARGIAGAFGGTYEATQSPSFVLVSRDGPAHAERTLARVERYREELCGAFPAVAFRGHLGPILLFTGPQADYYRFISTFFEDGEHPGSAGVFIVRGGWDVLAWIGAGADSDEGVVAHEMTHAALVSLRSLPIWLNEGLATEFEGRLMGRPKQRAADVHERGRLAALFQTATVDDFLSGWLFDAPGAYHDASYLLAQTLVLQFEPLASWRAFVSAARQQDGGIAAAREHLDIDLPAQVSATIAGLARGAIEPPPIEDVEAPDAEAFDTPEESTVHPSAGYKGMVVVALVVLAFIALDLLR